jgi:hypothetical protein
MRDDDDWTLCAHYKWRVYQQLLRYRFDIRAIFDENPVVCRLFVSWGSQCFT